MGKSNWFKSLFGEKAGEVIPAGSVDLPNGVVYGPNIGAQFIPLDSHEKILDLFGGLSVDWEGILTPFQQLLLFEKCPPLAAIIHKLAKANTNGRIKICKDIDDDELAVGKQAESLRKLFKKPNPVQTWRQFRMQQIIYKKLFGYCDVYVEQPAGFSDFSRVSAMWNLPPWMVTLRGNSSLPWEVADKGVIEAYVVSWNGEVQELAPDTVLTLVDNYVQDRLYPHLLRPYSRVRSLQRPITNILAAYEARNVLITKKGAIGILSNMAKDSAGHVPLKPGEKEDVQREYQRQYGLRGGLRQVIISSASLQWQAMSFPTKDLMLFEEIEDDMARICDEYSYPFEMIASPTSKNKTFNNVDAAKKTFYQDEVIPDCQGDMDMYEAYFNLSSVGMKIVADFAHLPILQDDQLKKSQAALYFNQALQIEYECDLITLNEWRVERGYKPVPGGDVYYSESAKGKLAELTAQNIANAQAQQQQQQTNTIAIPQSEHPESEPDSEDDSEEDL
jgi:hypothetical protein